MRRSVLLAVLTATLLAGCASKPSLDALLFVVNTNSKNVSVVDLAASRVVTTIELPGKPHGIDLEPGGKRVWTSNLVGDTVSIINVRTRKLESSIKVCAGPVQVAFAQGKAFAACSDGYVDMIDTTTLRILRHEAVGYAPHAIVAEPQGDEVWAVNRGTNDLSRINAKTGALVSRHPAGPFAYGAAFTPNGKYVFVTSKTWDAVSVLSTDDMRILGSVKTGDDPSLVAVSRDGKRVYVTNRLSGTVSEINGLTFQVIATIKVGSEPDGVALSDDGRLLYVTNFGSDSVSVVDTREEEQIRTIAVGDAPDDAVIVPK